MHWLSTHRTAHRAVLCLGLGLVIFGLSKVIGECTDEGSAFPLAGTPTPLRRVPAEVAAVADGSMVAYYMPALHGGQTIATAMLFIPKGPPPAGGWPLVVFGHDTNGWARECASSIRVQTSGQWEHTPWVVDMLQAGMVVIAPDYEGMGPAELGVPDTGHPYYNLLSTGRSMAFAAVAAKRALGDHLSGAWAAIGLSEGGFAALAAAQYSELAKQQEASLDYRGAVSVAPVPYLNDLGRILWDSIQAKSATHDLEGGFGELLFFNAETIYMVKSALLAGYDIKPADLYGTRMLHIYNTRNQLCLSPLFGVVNADITDYWFANKLVNTPATYPGWRYDASLKSPGLQSFIADNELGQVHLRGDTLLVQGSADTASLLPLVYRLENALLAHGSIVRLAVYEGADHFGVIIPALPVMRAHLHKLFANP